MQRPTSVTVFGILNIAFGLIGGVSLFFSQRLLSATVDPANPMTKVMEEPGYQTFLKISMPLGAVACAALIAAGIGLLLMKNWARVTCIIYAIYAVVMALVGAVVNYMFLFRPLLAEAQKTSGASAPIALATGVGTMIGSLTGLIYPALLLFFMTRPKIKAALKGESFHQQPPPLP